MKLYHDVLVPVSRLPGSQPRVPALLVFPHILAGESCLNRLCVDVFLYLCIGT